MVKSIAQIRNILFSLTLGVVTAACGGPAVPSAQDGGPAVLDMLEGLRPSESEARGLVASESNRRTPVSGDLALAPEGVTFTLVELTPMILRADGSLSPVGPGDGVNTMEAGEMVLLPYDFTYADATTSLSGQFAMQWVWDPSQYLFIAANPPMVFTFDGPTTGVTVSGSVYNGFLDMLEGSEFDNGEIVGARVALIDATNGDVFSTRSDVQGNFSFDLVPGDRTYTLQVDAAGYYPSTSSLALPVSGAVEGLRVSLMIMPSDLQRTTVVHGVISDLDGQPVGGIIAQIVNLDTGELLDMPGVQANWHGEYAIAQVPVQSGARLGVRVERNGRVSDAAIVVADPAQPAAWTRVDVTFQNHAPTVACIAPDGTTAAVVSRGANPGDLVVLSVVGADADDDEVVYFWQADGGSVQAGPGGTATFSMPMMEGTWNISAYPIDETFAIGSPCTFQLSTNL
jgi:hypothetical protein